jgi:glycosyltransferase involved in cell wall biosynthesis
MPNTADDKARLWVVSELYYPEETSTGYYLTRIAEGLTDKFEVKVISGQPNYSARGTKAAKREVRENVEIYRVSGTTWDKNIILFRLINMITLSLSAFFRSLASFRSGDRILVVTNPPSMPFVIALSSMFRGAVYSLLIHDNYPEILIAAGKMRQAPFFAHFMHRLNRWLYKNASKIIVVGRDMLELVEKKTSGLDIPVVFIPNWAELETVSPARKDGNELLDQLDLRGKFVLLYAGNMGPPNDIESIVGAAEILKDDDGIHFIFLGAGVKKSGLLNDVRDRGLSNVTVLDPKPRSEQIVFLNACDVALVSLVDKMLGVSVPSRTYNILAAGKPILALTEPRSEVARIVSEERVGWVVPPGHPEDLARTIRSMTSHDEDLEQMGIRARQAAETKYSLKTAIEMYRDAVR